MFSSHGQATKRIIEDTRGMLLELDEPAVLLLDEPDMALSPRSAHMLAKALNELAAAGHQIIAAVHNPIVIASQDKVLSMEHKRWMESKDFLAAHAE